MASSTQRQNLEEMLNIISSNSAAQLMLREVWEFTSFQLVCVICEDDGKPSKYRLDVGAFRASGKLADLLPTITLKKTPRSEEAFVHELLHLEVARRGFPRFIFRPPTDPKRLPLAAGIQNIADHVVMLPIFQALGYREDLFLGPALTPTEEEALVLRHFSAMNPICTPRVYGDVVAPFLLKHDIHFDSVSLAPGGV